VELSLHGAPRRKHARCVLHSRPAATRGARRAAPAQRQSTIDTSTLCPQPERARSCTAATIASAA
jgi:hypothetical protein